MPQAEGVGWMKAALERVAATAPVPDARRALRLYDLLARQTQIGHRVTSLEDYTHRDWGRMTLFASPHAGDGLAPDAHAWHQVPLEARMEVFARTADALAAAAFAGDAEAPDALVQVSCTGYESPNAVQRLVAARGWQDRTRVLHIGHMGCYAALPATALAADLAQASAARHTAARAGAEDTAPDARVAVLLVELCTLHHRPETTDVEQIVQQCLFADGAARVDVTAHPRPGAFALLDHAETIVPDTLGEMTWRVADGAFLMTLSRDVPRHIEARVGEVLGVFLARHGLAPQDVDVFAVHPGGPRVIESTAEALGLPEQKTRHSREVLFARGNMSSATLPHIWDAVARDASLPAGALVCSVAFGPGLTVAANLMRKG
ncbi:MAG: 3-oxoacyl-[acyl-carrier-protein] synthase III C-terminal domain-containing protein [Rubricoccaceae bacterium]